MKMNSPPGTAFGTPFLGTTLSVLVILHVLFLRGHLLERVLGGGGRSDTFYVPFFEVFVRSRSRFKNFSSAQGAIFKFLSFLSLNFFLCLF